MRVCLASVAGQLLSLSCIGYAALYRGPGLNTEPIQPSVSRVAEVNSTNGWGTFEQLLDHSDPNLGTFSQRYFYGTEYWGGPGSPIILVNLGQTSAEGFNETYLGDMMLPGLFAQTIEGAVVILEHRYWGESSPFDILTTENLQYLTLRNNLKDYIYFAQNWEAPFDDSGNYTPDKAPWVYTGCSYPGALGGWLAALYPGTFWAYQASAAVVQTIGDFWEWFRPVMEVMPPNCSTDVQSSIGHIDEILLSGDEEATQELKNRFALGDLEDIDFASYVIFDFFSMLMIFQRGYDSAKIVLERFNGGLGVGKPPNSTRKKREATTSSSAFVTTWRYVTVPQAIRPIAELC